MSSIATNLMLAEYRILIFNSVIPYMLYILVVAKFLDINHAEGSH